MGGTNRLRLSGLVVHIDSNPRRCLGLSNLAPLGRKQPKENSQSVATAVSKILWPLGWWRVSLPAVECLEARRAQRPATMTERLHFILIRSKAPRRVACLCRNAWRDDQNVV